MLTIKIKHKTLLYLILFIFYAMLYAGSKKIIPLEKTALLKKQSRFTLHYLLLFIR